MWTIRFESNSHINPFSLCCCYLFGYILSADGSVCDVEYLLLVKTRCATLFGHTQLAILSSAISLHLLLKWSSFLCTLNYKIIFIFNYRLTLMQHKLSFRVEQANVLDCPFRFFCFVLKYQSRNKYQIKWNWKCTFNFDSIWILLNSLENRNRFHGQQLSNTLRVFGELNKMI